MDEFFIMVKLEGGIYTCHSQVFVPWTPSLRKRFLRALKEFVKESGLREAFSCVPADDPLLNKFQVLNKGVLIQKRMVNGQVCNIYRMMRRCYK